MSEYSIFKRSILHSNIVFDVLCTSGINKTNGTHLTPCYHYFLIFTIPKFLKNFKVFLGSASLFSLIFQHHPFHASNCENTLSLIICPNKTASIRLR